MPRYRALVLDSLLALAVAVGLVVAPLRQHGGSAHRAPWADRSETLAQPGMSLTAPVVALIVVIAATVGFRRVRPVLAFAVCVVASGVYLFAGAPLPAGLVAPAITLVSLARGADARHRWLPWSLALVPMLWTKSWHQPYLGLARADTYLGIVFGMAVTVVPSLVVLVRAAGRNAAAARHTEELRRVAYEERVRVAREIHDVVGHSLSVISLQSGVALHVLNTNPGQVRESLEVIRAASGDSLAEVRRALDVFRLPEDCEPLTPSPRLDDLDLLVEPVRAGGHEVHLAYAPRLADHLPGAVQQAAYRIVQESLTNVVRHAPGAAVRVEVGRDGDELTVRVTDDGPPLRTTLVEGNGIRGMRERVDALRGRLVVSEGPRGGVRVEARLPIRLGEAR